MVYAFNRSYEGGQVCDVGIAVYFSGAAVFCFWVACLFLCCFPRPDPFCKNFGAAEAEPKERPEEPVRVYVQQQVDEPDYEEDYGDDADDYDDDSDDDDEAPPPKRKSSKRASKPEKITNDDFNDTPEIQEGTSNVEIKEKTFPDGSRRVDEITTYADGSQSVKTQTFDS